MRTAIMIGAAAFLLACRGGTDTRTFELRHMDPAQALEMVEPYVPGGSENMRMTREPASLTITAPEVRLEQVARVLETYDRAQPDVQLRFQIIEADGFTGTDPAIADVQQVLQDLFRFRGYRLLAEVVVQAQAPGHVLQQVVADDQRSFRITAELRRVISGEGGGAVDLAIDLSDAARGNTLIGTSLTVPSGQTVVVGSARAQADGNTLILVVRPRIP